MGAISDFASRLGIEFDPSRIFSPDVSVIEATKFTGEFVYKYHNAERREFFTRPRVRFTQKAGLNDPFELTKRWHKFGSAMARDEFGSFLKRLLQEAMNDKDFLLTKLQERMVRAPTNTELELLKVAIESDQFRALRTKAAQEMVTQVDQFISIFFSDSFGEELIEDEIHKIGIFSVSEVATSGPMWGLYADSGRGYVVELNAQHRFFRTDPADASDINLLRKVIYTNDKIEDFWSNPYVLFIVKESDYAFEREWRLIRGLDECRCVGNANGVDVFVRDLEPGIIRSIIFGYNYAPTRTMADATAIKAFDPSIDLKKATLDGRSGRIVIEAF